MVWSGHSNLRMFCQFLKLHCRVEVTKNRMYCHSFCLVGSLALWKNRFSDIHILLVGNFNSRSTCATFSCLYWNQTWFHSVKQLFYHYVTIFHDKLEATYLWAFLTKRRTILEENSFFWCILVISVLFHWFNHSFLRLQ